MDNGDIITGCTEFRYLETVFTKVGRDTKNIRYRVTQARKVRCIKCGMVVKEHNKKPEKMIYSSMVKIVLIYRAEIWNLYEDRRRINATEMDTLTFWYRNARTSKLDRKPNKIIRGKMDAQDILDEITRKQLIWYGHVERIDPTCLPKIMIHWEPERRKKQGCPRKIWKEGMYTAMKERDLKIGEWNNRRQWSIAAGRRSQT
jgi:hypothetical protein